MGTYSSSTARSNRTSRLLSPEARYATHARDAVFLWIFSSSDEDVRGRGSSPSKSSKVVHTTPHPRWCFFLQPRRPPFLSRSPNVSEGGVAIVTCALTQLCCNRKYLAAVQPFSQNLYLQCSAKVESLRSFMLFRLTETDTLVEVPSVI